MPRLAPPLEDFESDDLDFPAFQPPPRRKSSGATQTTPRRTPSQLSLDDAPPLPKARPRSTNRPATRNRLDEAPRRPQTSRPRNGQQRPAPRPRPVLRDVHFEIIGVLCLAFGGLLGFNALQPAPDGILMRYTVPGLRYLFGIGALILPLLICVLGGMLFIQRKKANLRAFWRGGGFSFLVLLTAAHLTVQSGFEFSNRATLWGHGGFVGGFLAHVLRRALGEVGAIVALSAFSLVGLLLWTETTLGELGARVRERLEIGVENARAEWQERREAKIAARDAAWEEQEADWDEEPALPEEILADARRERIEKPAKNRPSPFLQVEELLEAAPPEPEVEFSQAEAPFDPEMSIEDAEEAQNDPNAVRIEILNAPPPPSVLDSVQDLASEDDLTPNEALEKIALETATEGEKPRQKRPEGVRRHFGDGPPMPEYFDDAVRSLDPPVVPDVSGVEEDIQKGVTAVQETLAAFKIDARVTDVKRGPVITRYEVQPAPGVRVASIANLDRDLARSLSALAVRIEAPVPGKNVVGIEVPNKRVHLVRMRDVLEQPEFLAHQSKLAFVLGKDIAGQPKWADLTKMPHLLIAGSTNSGKSVCLNSIIASILARSTPEEVRFSLIDPKRVELTLYRGIKHLMHEVVVEPKQAVVALRRAIEEMDRRYKLFASRGVRNIVSFNQKLNENEKPMPYIVIVIDELADLMMTAAAEFEKLICRLAQLARATGIHLIVATQRPSVNVITGVIKANIPARIAFAVASQVDSRTILDSVGAERLIGSGDMLFDANNGGKSVRIQGAFLSEEEVNRIVDVVKNAYLWEDEDADDLPKFDLYVEENEDDDFGSKSSPDEKRDDLYDGIKEFVLRHQEMSASMIQRKFEIGYPRAGRIVDQLERDGVLGPPDGPKPRKVLGPGKP